MAESANIATVSRTTKSDRASSMKNEKEDLMERNEKAGLDNEADQLKAQHQPLLAAAPKRRGKGKKSILRQ